MFRTEQNIKEILAVMDCVDAWREGSQSQLRVSRLRCLRARTRPERT
jgi:hypothetical protein